MTTGTMTHGSLSQDGVTVTRTWSGADTLRHDTETVYSMQVVERRWSTFTQQYYNKTTGPTDYLYGRYYNGYVASSLHKPEWDANSEVKLLSKAASTLRQHSFNAGITTSQLGLTLKSVTSTANSIFMALRLVKRGQITSALKTLSRAAAGTGVTPRSKGTTGARQANTRKMHHSEIPQAHLAVTYALMPLLQDIEECMKWIESLTASPRQYVTKVRSTQPARTVDHTSTYGSPYPFPVKETVMAELRIVVMEEVSQMRALGLVDFRLAVWDILWMSFVVDWFIPIASYLDAVSYFDGIKLSYARSMLYRSEGAKRFTRCEEATWPLYYPQWPHNSHCHPEWVNGPDGGFCQHTMGTSIHRVVWLDRSVGNHLDVPLPGLKTMEQVWSLPHLQNAAALIWSGIASARK